MEVLKRQLLADPVPAHLHRQRLFACFIFPSVLSILVALVFQPIQLHQAEEYLALALQSGATPVGRPPGYVAFLRIIDVLAGKISANRLAPVYIGQGVVLGLATMVWYITACRWLASLPAWLMALAFGCNPLMIVLVGYIHYDMLHVGLSVLTGLLLIWAFAGHAASRPWAVCAGIACGALTLVRPMTLVEPIFLALALCLRPKPARQCAAWLAWVIFSVAMATTLIPRTWSNYTRTRRFFPVNAQFWSQIWPMFEEPIHPNSDNFPWVPLWYRRGLPLLEKKVGAAALDPDYVELHQLVREDVCRSRIRELIRTQPWVYFSNFVHNALFFLTGDSRRRIQTFVFYQDQDSYVFPATWAASFFVVSSALLRIGGVLGLALGLWRRDPTVMMLASLFVCFWMTHSLVYLDYRFLYIKLPFLLWFNAYLLGEYAKTAHLGNRHITWISAVFTVSSLLGTALLVF